MNLFDLFENREPHQQAIDRLEGRRIDDLNMKMLDLLDRAKSASPEMKDALKREFQKLKAERDSYFGINPETGMNASGTLGTTKGALDEEGPLRRLKKMMKGGRSGVEKTLMKSIQLEEGSMKDMLWDLAEKMDRNQFISYVTSEMGFSADEAGEFWDSINGPLEEASDTVKLDPKTGKPVAWSHEGDWEKIKKRNGKPVDPRGEVTHMSDVERRKAEKMDEWQNSAVGDDQDDLNAVKEHGGGVNGMKNYISWRKKANTERGVTKGYPPVGKPASPEKPVPKGSVKKKLDTSKGVIPRIQFDESDSVVDQDNNPKDPYHTNYYGGVDEGWSNKMVARRTGQAPTPYSVFISGKEWKSFPDDDHAENVANKLRAKFEAEGRDPSVITIAPTEYDKGIKEDTGSWIVYDPETKQIKKRFKTHTAGKSYAKTHGLGFASSEYYFDNIKQPVNELNVNTLKNYASKRGAQVAAMKADEPNPAPGSKEWVKQAIPAQQVARAKQKIARAERQQDVAEVAVGGSGQRVFRNGKWVDPKTTKPVKEHGGGGGGPRQWHAYVKAHRADEDVDTNYTYTVYIDGNAIGTYGSKEEAKAVVRRKKEQAPGRDYRIKPKSRTSAASIKRFNKNRDRYDEGYHTNTISAMSDFAYEPKVGDSIWVRDGKGGKVYGQVVELRPGVVVFKADDNKRYRIPAGRVVRDMEEESMASAAHNPTGPKFGGYYKGTQKGPPRPGQSFGGAEESKINESMSDENQVESAILKRMIVAHKDVLKEYGPTKVLNMVRNFTYQLGPEREMSERDVKEWTNLILQDLGAV